MESLGDQPFRVVFAAALDAMVVSDGQGHLLEVNASACELLGSSMEVLVGQQWRFLVRSPQQLSGLLGLLADGGSGRGELELITAGGVSKTVEYSVSAAPGGSLLILQDVTERIQREKELLVDQLTFQTLQNSELRLRQIAEVIDEVIFIKSVDNHRVLYVSPAYERIWGRTCESLYQDPSSWIEGIHADDLDTVLEMVDQDFSLSSSVQRKEYRLIRPDGSCIWVADSVAPIIGKTGEIEYVAGIVLDITTRKEAQLALMQRAERERLLRTLTQHIRQSLDINEILVKVVEDARHLLEADRVVICRFQQDWSGEIITESVGIGWPVMKESHLENPSFREIWGKQYYSETFIVIDDIQQVAMSDSDRQLLKGLNIHALLVAPIVKDNTVWGLLCVHYCGSPHIWQEWEIHLLQTVADQLAIAIHQSDLFHQSQVWTETLEQQVEERTADLQQALDFESTLRSITDQVRSSLDEAEILQVVVETLGQGLKADGCYVSHYHEDRLHYTVDHEWTPSYPSVRGRTYPSNPDLRDQPNRHHGIQYCLDHPDVRWVTVANFLISFDPGIPYGFMTLARPKTSFFSPREIRLAEQVATQCSIAIRQARLYQSSQAQVEKLKELNNLKQDFINTVSHELRTPLTSMKLAITMLERSQNKPEKQERYLTILKSEWNRELNLVNGLLELQSLESGKKSYSLSMVDVAAWLSSLVESFRLRCEQHQQLLQIEWDPEIQSVYTDFYLLDRILTELLNNACKYTPSQQLIKLTVNKLEKGIRFQITNTGVTIPADQIGHIFDKFYRVADLDHFNQGGTGLGLALVQKMVALLGGMIVAESVDNVTTFRLDLPSTTI